jgi:hypothetical protein
VEDPGKDAEVIGTGIENPDHQIGAAHSLDLL